VKLDLGSGPFPREGYLHLDLLIHPHVEVLGHGTNLPFKIGSFSEVRISHVIEHFSVENGLRCLREAHRVLEEGGRIEISCPNFSYLCQGWLGANVRVKLAIKTQNVVFGEGSTIGQIHHSAQDPDTIGYLLRCSGFINMEVDLTTRGPRDFIVYGVKR